MGPVPFEGPALSQRCAALGAVALPAGTTVGQGHLPRVSDGDPFAADASGVWVGLRCVWVPCARFNHDPGSILAAGWLSRGLSGQLSDPFR
jgi:hypothetical protein